MVQDITRHIPRTRHPWNWNINSREGVHAHLSYGRTNLPTVSLQENPTHFLCHVQSAPEEVIYVTHRPTL
jgi:hypothetical protein